MSDDSEPGQPDPVPGTAYSIEPGSRDAQRLCLYSGYQKSRG